MSGSVSKPREKLYRYYVVPKGGAPHHDGEGLSKQMPAEACHKCKQLVQPTEQIAVRLGIGKRPEMPAPAVEVTVECPYCGCGSNLGLSGPIDWPDFINWIVEIGTGKHRADAPTSLVAVVDVPVEQRIWLKNGQQTWLLRIVGGFERGSMTYLLVNCIPIQRAGWDGRAWDGMVRVRRDQCAEIMSDEDPMYLPTTDWADFLALPDRTEFRIGGGISVKLSSSSSTKIATAGTLTAKS